MKAERRTPYPVYVKRPARTWWLRTPYRRFAAREATAIFAAAFSVIMLLFLVALSRGPGAYEGFLRWLRLPGIVVLSAVIFVAVVYHALTWFNLSSRILVIRLGGKVVPPKVVVALMLTAWLAISVVVAFFHVWFSR